MGDCGLGGGLWCGGEFWWARLFALSPGVSGAWDWCGADEEGYKRRKWSWLLLYVVLRMWLVCVLFFLSFCYLAQLCKKHTWFRFCVCFL